MARNRLPRSAVPGRFNVSMLDRSKENDFDSVDATIRTVQSNVQTLSDAKNASSPILNDYYSVSLTSQNEFYGDQLGNVVKWIPASEFDDMRVFVKNTNTSSFGSLVFKLQYHDGSAWVDSGLTIDPNAPIATMYSSAWTNIPNSMQGLADCYVRLYRTVNDANTDIPSADLVLRRSI